MKNIILSLVFLLPLLVNGQINTEANLANGILLTPQGIKSSKPNTSLNDTTNISFGPNALERNTHALNNTAIGISAMRFLNFTNAGTPFSSDNVAVGMFALENTNPASATTGIKNVAVGNFALRNNTQGVGNTSVGNKSSQNLGFTSNYNTAFGFAALGTYRKSSNNTAVGAYAMGNTADTSSALLAYNTALGFEALFGGSVRSNNVGIRNTAIGARSLYNFSSGSNNVAFGHEAGFYITTGSGNVMIGNQAGGTVNVSNQLFIANTNTDNPLIKGDFATGNLKINNKLRVGGSADLPEATLHVEGDFILAGTVTMNSNQTKLLLNGMSTLRVTGGGTKNLSGIEANGQMGYILNVWVENNTTLILDHVNTTIPSIADMIDTGDGGDITITNGGAATLMYDALSARWRLMSIRL